jgi:hypothetical protein
MTRHTKAQPETPQHTSPLDSVLQFPLLQALFGRRARRFGLGMEIPSGPMAYRSEKEPLPLTEQEQMLLVAAATGVSGWTFGVPFGPRTPQSHAEFTLRFTGRTAYFNGMDGLSAMGANASDGVAGLGFTFTHDDRWVTPNAVGLDGIYEALCPPYYPDMHAAVEAFVARKFGPQGAYAPAASETSASSATPATPGPWRDSAGVRGTVAPYSSEFVDCMSEVAATSTTSTGSFPASVPP